jgi:hypothetical protein
MKSVAYLRSLAARFIHRSQDPAAQEPLRTKTIP